MPLAGLLLLGGAILGLFYLVPRTRPFGRFRPALLTVTGFILAQAGLSAAITALDLVPKGPFRDLLHEFTSYEGERPVVLLVGSSFSAAGVDPDALAAALGSSGTVPMVQSFAVGGAPHIERLYYLKEFLSRAKRKPQLVLFEIAGR